MKLLKIFERCQNISLSKRHDYTSSTDSHENFKRSAEIASWFKSDDDKSYAVLVGTKLARLASLLDTKKPNNESIDDTFIDLVNYCALWMERRTETSTQYGIVEDGWLDEPHLQKSKQETPPRQCMALLAHAPTLTKDGWTEACQLQIGHSGVHEGLQTRWN